jgi:hypothetical protein
MFNNKIQKKLVSSFSSPMLLGLVLSNSLTYFDVFQTT